MKQFVFILVLITTIQTISSACDCNVIRNLKEAQKSSYENSDVVFTAKVVSVGESMKNHSEGWFNNKIFEVEVLENFKGTEIGKILKGHALTSCSAYPDTGIWLIYANIDNEGLISLSICGLSRAFQNAEHIYFDGYTPRPPTKEEYETPNPNIELDWAIERAQFKLKAANDLKEEVLWLRSLK